MKEFAILRSIYNFVALVKMDYESIFIIGNISFTVIGIYNFAAFSKKKTLYYHIFNINILTLLAI